MINRKTLTTTIDQPSFPVYLWNWEQNYEDKVNLFLSPENLLDITTLDQSTFFPVFYSRNETYMIMNLTEEDILAFLIEQDFDSMVVNFKPKNRFLIHIRIQEKDKSKQDLIEPNKHDSNNIVE